MNGRLVWLEDGEADDELARLEKAFRKWLRQRHGITHDTSHIKTLKSELANKYCSLGARSSKTITATRSTMARPGKRNVVLISSYR